MPKILKDIKLQELSLVDRGANQHAKISITKSENSDLESTIYKYFVDSIDYGNSDYKTVLDQYKDVLTQHLQQQAFYEAREKIYTFIDALGDSIAGYLSDPKLTDDDRTAKITLAVSDFLGYIKEEVTEISSDEELTEIFEELAEVPAPGSDANIGKNNMPAENLEKALAELTKKYEEVVAKNAELAACANMSDEEKTFVAKMTPEEKKKFMEATAEEKKKQMDGVKKSDETIIVGGETIAKSAVGDASFAVFKRLAAAEERIAKAEEAAEMAKLEKRAADEFKHLPGTPATIAKMLKAIDAMDADVSKSLTDILKSADANAEGAFKKNGAVGGNVDDNADSQIEKFATEIAARDKIGKAAAIAKAWVEHPELYEG